MSNCSPTIKIVNVILFSVFALAGKILAQEIGQDSISLFYDLSDVVVTAQYAPTDSRQALYKIRSIKREIIDSRGTNNLEQLLNQELNIRISQDMILGSSINLQGVSGQNVKIMIDGVPVIGRVGDDIDLSQINLSNIERVEIIEGPMSVNYGTNALGGVINLITRKSQLRQLDLKVSSQYESVGTRFLNGQFGFKPGKKWLWRGDLGYNRFEGFNSIPPQDSLMERTYQWNPKTSWFANSMLRFNTGDESFARWNAGLFVETIENLGAVRRPQYKPYAFDEYYHTRRSDQSLAWEGRVSKQLFGQFTGAYNNFERIKESIRLDLETGDQTRIHAEEDTTAYEAFIFRPVIASQFSNSAINFQAGLDFNYEKAGGKRFQDLSSGENFRASIGDYAAFLALQYTPTEAVHIQLGARVAYNTKFNAPLVPSLHLKYDLNENMQFRASYASGFRSPSVKELFFYFVDASHFIIGNPNLNAETSHNFQAIADLHLPKTQNLKLTITAFFNDITNKIELYDFVEIDGLPVPAASLGQTSTRFAYFNQDRYKTLGMNLRSSLKFNNLGIDAGLAPIGRYNPLSETGLADTYTYATEWSGRIGYRIDKIKLEGQFFIRYNDKLIRYYQTSDVEGNPITLQAVQDGFTMADLVFTKKIEGTGISLSGGIKNLFDVKNINTGGTGGGAHTGGDAGSPIATGINYFARLSWSLEN
jgi:outer membrane receptor for ferrienterochelin and colicins